MKKKRICSDVLVNSPVNPWSPSWRSEWLCYLHCFLRKRKLILWVIDAIRTSLIKLHAVDTCDRIFCGWRGVQMGGWFLPAPVTAVFTSGTPRRVESSTSFLVTLGLSTKSTSIPSNRSVSDWPHLPGFPYFTLHASPVDHQLQCIPQASTGQATEQASAPEWRIVYIYEQVCIFTMVGIWKY